MIKDLLQEILPIAGPLLSTVTLLMARAKTNKEERKTLSEATEAILTAVDKTHGYLQHLEQGGERVGEREEDLAELWRTASFHLYQVATTDEEKKLAGKLRLKAASWDYTGQWPDDKVRHAGIDFETVSKELLKLRRLNLPESDHPDA
jgi:hypothetical protein